MRGCVSLCHLWGLGLGSGLVWPVSGSGLHMLLVRLRALPGFTVFLASLIPGRQTGHLGFSVSVEGQQTLAGLKWNSSLPVAYARLQASLALVWEAM